MLKSMDFVYFSFFLVKLDTKFCLYRFLFLDRIDHVWLLYLILQSFSDTVEPRFNEVAGDRVNLFVKSRVRYIENPNITNLRGNDQNVRHIDV